MTPSARWKWLRLAAGLSAASYVAIGQAELPIKQFQAAGTTAFGVAALGGGLLPTREGAEAAKAAVDLWNRTSTTEDQVLSYLWAYTIVDVVLISCLTWFLYLLARQVASRYTPELSPSGIYSWNTRPLRGRPLLLFWVFGVAEALLRMRVYCEGGDTRWYYAAWGAENLKFAALLLVVLALVAGYHKRVRPEPEVARKKRNARLQALRVLRGQVGLVVVVCMLLVIDVTGQVSDLLRRWTDLESALIGLVALLVFSLVIWASGRRIALPTQKVIFRYQGVRTSDEASILLLGTFALAALIGWWLASKFDTNVPWALAIVLFVLLLLEAVWLVAARPVESQIWKGSDPHEEAKEARKAATGDRRLFVQALGRFLAALPVAVVGIVLVRAGTGPLVLSSHDYGPGHELGYKSGPASGLMLLGLTLVVAACLLIPCVLSKWDRAVKVARIEIKYGVLAAIVLVAAVVLIRNPIEAPQRAGSLAVALVALGVLGLAFAELQRFAEIVPAPRGMALVGFKRVPIFIILAAWFAVASVLDGTGHHDIRTLPTEPGGPHGVVLNELWDEWLAENCLAGANTSGTDQETGGAVPLVFVTAHGGGIRAAYWTGSVLTSLLDDSQKVEGCGSTTGRSRVFALSSISGGSVGAAAYLAQEEPSDDWYKASLGDPDYSAVALARGLLVDLPRALVGFGKDDRAGLLERAWEENIEGLDADYFTAFKPGNQSEQWMPITMLSAAQAETGCRINTSSVRLANPDLEKSPDCRATLGSDRLSDVDHSDDQTLWVPTAPVTVDSILVARDCSVSFRVSTAALMSARWPYISPSGRIPCGDSAVSAIDGGYADPAGYAAFVALWQRLAPLVAEHNAQVVAADDDPADDRVPGLVVPMLVVVDNHYLSPAKAAETGQTPELLVPPKGQLRASNTRGADREQTAMSVVAASPPGTDLECRLPADLHPMTEKDPVRRVVLAPNTQPGLPAPLAWTLAPSSRDDLDGQRDALFNPQKVGDLLRDLLAGVGSTVECE